MFNIAISQFFLILPRSYHMTQIINFKTTVYISSIVYNAAHLLTSILVHEAINYH